MSDVFHQALSSIISILKTSPGSISIQNIQRLANIYKFESFIESINDTTKRLSIAGNILVIDIDYKESDRSTKDHTRPLLEEMKLILANNNNSFNYRNSLSNENILQNSLTKYDNLTKFDKLLGQLSIFDQFSNDKFDLYDYYIKVYDILVENFGEETVELNFGDELKIRVGGVYVVSILNDERLSLSKLEPLDNEWKQSGVTINDIGLQVEFLGDELSIPASFLIKNDIVFDDGQKITIFNSNDNYKNKEGLIFQGFQFLESEVIQLRKISGDNIVKIIDTLKIMAKFNQFILFVKDLKSQFELIDKFTELQQEDTIFQEFMNGEIGDDGMEIDPNNYLTITLTQEKVDLKSNQAQFTVELDYQDPDFTDKLASIQEKIKTFTK